VTESERLAGGELNAAITREVVRILTASLGRGPKKASSFHNGSVVVTLMEEGMTPAERSLAAGGEADEVLRIRRAVQRTLHDELISSLERLTRRRVVAFMSDNNIDPDLAVEVFVLDRPV
jgi:uncharacterized protein YbcI